MDQQYKDLQLKSNELSHGYGENIHVLSHPYLLTHLARFCSPESTQPEISNLIQKIYLQLFPMIINQELPIELQSKIATRMNSLHSVEGYYIGPTIKKNINAIVVSLARAGILPSHTLYHELNQILEPTLVRQDHISISRVVDGNDKVTRSQVADSKCGGTFKDAYIFIPDPMGATGSTIIEIYEFYKKLGSIKKIISIHCIVTPEFLKKIKTYCPDLIVYTVRVDRGLSSEKALSCPLGTYWNEEKGLNKTDYIVPGAGGIGEILNNVY